MKGLEETSQQVIQQISSKFLGTILEIKKEPGLVSVVCKREDFLKFIRWLKEEAGFIHLIDLCGVDYLGYKHKTFEERFEVVYHLFNFEKKLIFRIKVRIPEEDPWQFSIVDLWKEADWFERECFDMFGIKFKGHPNLKRILMPENWEGYPLRKDYPLFLEEENEWEDFRNLLKKVRNK